jgi:hypothetical protein
VALNGDVEIAARGDVIADTVAVNDSGETLPPRLAALDGTQVFYLWR